MAQCCFNAAMEHGATLDHISDRAGWAWQHLAAEQVSLAWPLLTIAGDGLSREAWQALAHRWLKLTDYGAGGLGAVKAESGAFVAIAGYRFVNSKDSCSLRLGFLRVVEPGVEPLVLRAVLRAIERIAKSRSCSEVLILAEPRNKCGWVADLEHCRQEFRAEACNVGWRLPVEASDNVVFLKDARR